MSEMRIHGRPINDAQIQAWADEAEACYDLGALTRSLRERPPRGDGPGVTVSVRLDAKTLAALMARAREQNITSRSDALRAAVDAWPHTA